MEVFSFSEHCFQYKNSKTTIYTFFFFPNGLEISQEHLIQAWNKTTNLFIPGLQK